MNALSWLTRRRTTLPADQQQRCAVLPAPRAADDTPLAQQRLVVLDLETSGLDTKRDEVLSIGAVIIDGGAIQLGEQFECTLQRDGHTVSASVLIHGLAPSAIAAGIEPAEALLAFMEFLGDSPLLAFHAGFDQRMLARALKDILNLRLRHPFYDVAELAPMLCPQADIRNGGLDDWTAHFALQVGQRHHASADALVTAELALILFSRARKQQADSLKALEQRLKSWRQRLQGHSL
ncbi:PolC-type DNA polymerase III [Pseudomonas sp. URMO17WK12:I2]|uniref:3'-5' exonuclease n=1 Tax=Pseudomonas sp. URMO17WK12:I2 TaxID=1261623 RepID=UPI000DAE1D45|nr:3'-5' exonuclease [Pseudomonas sp. URMO17WK12:I2]PZW49836.1 DNA polymerase-3 subunit epsilon [Pseudomonas sp. URMO17WK12:I2]